MWGAFAGCVLAAMMVSCGQQEGRARIPVSLQGEGLGDEAWRCGTVTELDAEAAPEALRRLGVTGGKLAAYTQRERTVQVRVYELGGGTAAFEAVQTYPRVADEYYFQMGASFVVVEAEALRNEERRPFLLAFQAAAMPDGGSQ